MLSTHFLNFKYVQFNHLILLSWHISNTSIDYIINLSNKVAPQKLKKIIPSSEFFILSTCNRVEIYTYSENPHNILDLLKKYILSKFNY